MAHEWNNPRNFFHFTIPPALLEPSVPRPGPYLLHGVEPNQLQQYSNGASPLQFMPYTASPSTSIGIKRIAAFRRILLVCRDINRNLWKKKPPSPTHKYGGHQNKRSQQKCFIVSRHFQFARFCNLNLPSYNFSVKTDLTFS